MKYVVKHRFKGVVDGEIYPRTFDKGDVIEGDLGLAAYNGGFADKQAEKKQAKTSTKRKTSRGRKRSDSAAG